MMQQSLQEEAKGSEDKAVLSIESPNNNQGFDDMIRDSAGNVNQCTDEIVAATIEVARLRFDAFEYAQAEELCATSQFPDEVYRDLLNDDDRQHVDGCITAMAIEQGTAVPTFLIDSASLDIVPKPVFCKSPKEIPTDSVSGRYTNPRSYRESQTRMDHAEFLQAYYKELLNIKEKEVLIHGFTREQFIEMGIMAKPIPLAALFEIKWVNGTISKYKVRLVALGHPGNVTPGVHWQGSKYAATPLVDFARVFVALCVHFGWCVKYFDAVTAFLNGAVKDTEKIPVRFPPELRTFDAEGNEMLALLNIQQGSIWTSHCCSAMVTNERCFHFEILQQTRMGMHLHH